MAEDNNNRDDSFDEFLNRAEEDFDADEKEVEEDGILDDVDEPEVEYEDDDDELGGSSLSGELVSDEMKAQALMVDMPSAHGEIVEGANGGEGTIVRSAYLGKEMQTSFLEYSMSVPCPTCATV